MPPLLKIDYEALGVFFTCAAFIVGIGTWWLSKLLAANRDSIIYGVKIEKLEEEMKAVQEELRETRNKKHRDG